MTPTITQEVGESRFMRFDFSPALRVAETLSAAPTITSTRVAGSGANATVSAIALSPDSKAATCLVATSAAGRFRLLATGTAEGMNAQTIIIARILEVPPLPT